MRKRVEVNSPVRKSGYTTQQSLTRATNKVKQRMLTRPGKKREAVKILFKQLNIQEEETEYRKVWLDRIALETINKVKDFYQRDDVSRIAPGKRDVIIVKTDKGKEKLQWCHLYIRCIYMY